MYSIFRVLPKNIVSFLVGLALRVRLPEVLAQFVIGRYIKLFNVETNEIVNPVGTYRSLSEFFVRKLKADARPMGSGIVSPVDGSIEIFGAVEGLTLVQTKGKTYTLEQLLECRDLANQFAGGSFVTLYLSPRDYHHVHSPASGMITEMRHIEGKLWPVNRWSVENVEGLFTVNERIITVIQSVEAGKILVVKVGATNVGSIRLSYVDYCTNQAPFARLIKKRAIVSRSYNPPIPINKGAALGVFELGSTVILVFQRGKVNLEQLKIGPIKVGQSLCGGA